MEDRIVQESATTSRTGAELVQEYHMVADCEVEVPQPAGLIIFGASGDLTRRKLFPSLFRLFQHGMLPKQFFILGTSRITFTTEQFCSAMGDSVRDAFPRDFDQAVWDKFALHVYYTSLEYDDLSSYTKDLVDILPRLEENTRPGATGCSISPSRRRCSNP